MAVRIINESLPADSEKKYGKARLKQQEEQKLNEELGKYTKTLNKLKEIKHEIYSDDIKDSIPSEMLFLLGRLKTEIDHIVNELDKYNSVENYKIKVDENKKTVKEDYSYDQLDSYVNLFMSDGISAEDAYNQVMEETSDEDLANDVYETLSNMQE